MSLRSITILLSLVTIFSCCQNKRKSDHQPKKAASKKHVIPKKLWDTTNTLEKKVRTLRLRFISVGCACPEWIRLSDLNKENNLNYSFYIEPADTTIWNPEDDSIAWKTGIIVTGQFYVKPSYPKGTYEGMEETPPVGTIFRFTKAKRDIP